MKIDCIIGIDPGASGGIAVWRPNAFLKVVKMPKDLNDIKHFLNQYLEISSPIVFLEKLSVRPDDVTVDENGKKNMGKMFQIQKMLAQFEQLKALLTFMGIPFILVNPLTWQTTLKLRISGGRRKEEKKDRKNRYKEIAGRLYPEFIATLWSCDATLLVHFGRVVLRNDQNWVLSNLPNNMHNKLF